MNPVAEGDRRCTARPGAFVLLEVMVAIALLGAVLGGLVHGVQIARDAASSVREKSSTLSGQSLAGPSLGARTWGHRVETASWATGPELTVRAGSGVGLGGTLGAWAGGWLLGEWEISDGGSARLGPSVWAGLEGRPLIVRVRSRQGAWGPPWRTLVPGGEGGALASSAVTTLQSDPLGFLAAAVAVHTQAKSAPTFVASWAATPVDAELDGLVYLLTSSTAGVCVLESDGRLQSWLGQTERRLDVYF